MCGCCKMEERSIQPRMGAASKVGSLLLLAVSLPPFPLHWIRGIHLHLWFSLQPFDAMGVWFKVAWWGCAKRKEYKNTISTMRSYDAMLTTHKNVHYHVLSLDGSAFKGNREFASPWINK